MKVADYRYATAVEAVMGFLYISGQGERLDSLLSKIMVAEPRE
jgi:ribonuclease-3 family protein